MNFELAVISIKEGKHAMSYSKPKALKYNSCFTNNFCATKYFFILKMLCQCEHKTLIKKFSSPSIYE